MSKNFLQLAVASYVMISALSGCNSCSSEHNSNIEDSVSFEDITIEDAIEDVYYSLPSPEELMEYVKANDIMYDSQLLLDKDYAMSAQTSLKKNLLLGAYLSDIAYLSLFSQTDELPNYLHNVKYLASELGLYTELVKDNEELLGELARNPSGLQAESEGIYGDIINFVQNNDDGSTMALIVTGAYIESLYMMIELHPDINAHKKAVERIVEQKILLDDVLVMLKKTNSESNKIVYETLVELNTMFSKFEIKSSVDNVVKSQDGSIQIVNSSQIELSAEYYAKLRQQVAACRSKFLSDE